jgi:hypothetical protein
VKPSEGIKRRIFEAYKRHEAAVGHKVGQADFGEAVADVLKRKPAYHQGTVADWLDRGVRDVDVLYGIATVCGVSFLWLALGEEPSNNHATQPLRGPGPDAVRMPRSGRAAPQPRKKQA